MSVFLFGDVGMDSSYLKKSYTNFHYQLTPMHFSAFYPNIKLISQVLAMEHWVEECSVNLNVESWILTCCQ